MDFGDARHTVDILAEGDGFLEYMIDPMILFPNANFSSRVNVSKGPESTVVLTDAYLAHDPTGGDEVFSCLHNEIRIEDLDGNLKCLDRNVFTGDSFTGEAVGIMGPHTVHGTFVLLNETVCHESTCNALRDSLQPRAGVYAGVSTLPNDSGIWARILALEAVGLRATLTELWRAVRKMLLGSYPGTRRK
jgi:urease accessory protein